MKTLKLSPFRKREEIKKISHFRSRRHESFENETIFSYVLFERLNQENNRNVVIRSILCFSFNSFREPIVKKKSDFNLNHVNKCLKIFERWLSDIYSNREKHS